jgi:O-6-methylguanine DNA methyltransferase
MTRIHTARFDSPIGKLTVASSDLGLSYVALPRANGRGLAGWQQRHAPDSTLAKGFEPNREAIGQILEFLEGKRRDFDLDLDLRGTPFQVAVYRQVASIPFGESRSYADVAEQIGRPRAVRAVGAANGANPIPLVIPCHRVLASNGNLQGYAGGLDLKAKLLAMESAVSPGQGALF